MTLKSVARGVAVGRKIGVTPVFSASFRSTWPSLLNDFEVLIELLKTQRDN